MPPASTSEKPSAPMPWNSCGRATAFDHPTTPRMMLTRARAPATATPSTLTPFTPPPTPPPRPPTACHQSGQPPETGGTAPARRPPPRREAPRTGLRLPAGDHIQAAAGLDGARVDELVVPLLVAAQPVVAHAQLWERADLVGERGCFGQRLSRRAQTVDE